MFLLHTLAAFTVAFWISAVVAQVVMRSPEEAGLSPAVRVGFGFFIALAYFSAAWQFVAIGYAWWAGLALLALYAAGRPAPAAAWLAAIRDYARAYAFFLAGAALFFLPMLLAWTFGPFTEGGGDISIYADTAKYLVDRGLTESGLPSKDASSPLMYPPQAEYAAYRVLAVGTLSRFLYAPYAMFSFLAGATNYAVFHGVQCLMYVLAVAGCWHFFARHGRRIAILATGFVLASHALVSVHYNTYSAQAISLASCALMLAAIPHVRLVSWAGLRTYGVILIVAWVSYVHYLAVLVPVALAALAPPRRMERASMRLPATVAAGAFVALLATLAWAAARDSWELASVLLNEALAAGAGMGSNPYLGEPVPAWSAKWLGFAFGVVSQQHVSPLSSGIGVVDLAVRAALAAGIACVALGFVATARAASAGVFRGMRRDLVVYALALLTIAVHLYLVRKSMYTQAKGAQNVLLLTYAAMALPLAFQARLGDARRFDRWTRRALFALAASFLVLLLVPRAAFMARFAGGFDRTSILEPSYFEEAKRVRDADPQALVLVEPRGSSDLYAASQSFFGARMLPTRHVVLKKPDPRGGPYGVAASLPEFIEAGDLAHLWTLRPEREAKWQWLGRLPYVSGYLPRPAYRTTWRAERLAGRRQALAILSGDLYERPSERSAATTAPPGFATLRNATASIFLPAGVAATLAVELRPGSAAGYPALEEQMRRHLEAGELGADVKMTTVGDALVLAYALPATPNAALRVVARCQDRCFARLRLDGNDLQ